MSRPPQLQRKPGIRHARVGIGIDVAACSERAYGTLFAQANAYVTCEACKTKRAETKGSSWQAARLRKIAQAKKLAARSNYSPRGF